MGEDKKVTKEQMNTLPYIIAVDFDGTLVEDEFPKIGKRIDRVWSYVKAVQNAGAKIILWTSRNGQCLKEAVEYCVQQGLHFDAINENLDECKVLFDNDTRKVYANEYWDDKAVGMFCDFTASRYINQASLL